MDNLKLFAKSKEYIDSLVQTVFRCSKDTGMEFEIWKFVVYTIKRSKPTAVQYLNLSSDKRAGNPEERGYKYLGVLKLDDINFVLSVLSFMKIHDSQDGRERGRLSLYLLSITSTRFTNT